MRRSVCCVSERPEGSVRGTHLGLLVLGLGVLQRIEILLLRTLLGARGLLAGVEVPLPDLAELLLLLAGQVAWQDGVSGHGHERAERLSARTNVAGQDLDGLVGDLVFLAHGAGWRW